jgi:hypothetical protein
MIAAPAPAVAASVLPRRAGRFEAFLRNRMIGQEVMQAAETDGGGLRLEAVTTLGINGSTLSQTTTAVFGPDLRPEWCIVALNFGLHSMGLELRVEGWRASALYDVGGRHRAVTKDLTREPLLLVDNCFSLHALGAVLVGRQVPEGRSYTALPAFEDLRATLPGAAAVLLGGREYDPPTVTLEVRRDLQEHVWLGDGWMERLVAPHLHLRVDWIREDDRKGGL